MSWYDLHDMPQKERRWKMLLVVPVLLLIAVPVALWEGLKVAFDEYCIQLDAVKRGWNVE